MATRHWYLYVVKCRDTTLYTGITTDLKRRLQEHNTSSKGSKYTRTRRPVTLVYQQAHRNRSEAQKAEYAFKRLTKQQKIEIIKKSEKSS